MKFDEKRYEEIVNITYPGITMLYRDVNLGSLETWYSKDIILREKGFTDASKHGGGMITTHRFAILSNHYSDVTKMEHGTHWGLCVMQSDSHFKVLDVYKNQGKTQITLLHLPKEGWELFKTSFNNVDEQLIEYTRKRFDICLELQPIPELTTDVWIDRCSFPLGVSDEGEYFPL